MTASAHPVVFRPIITRLRESGHEVHITARDYAQTLGLHSDSFPNADELYWVQEEPENMGAWRFVQLNAQRRLGIALRSVAREESASPATGSLRIHQREQAALLDASFAGLKTDD